MYTWLPIFIILPLALGEDCSTAADGTYEVGCTSYVVCANHVQTIHTCTHGKVYNNATKQCDLARNVGAPCGLIRDCKNKADGSYADHETGCKSYYTCSHHVFFQHNFCTPGTVFDDHLQTCNWPENVLPPCGTYHPTTTPPLG